MVSIDKELDIRLEQPGDISAIHDVTAAAFAPMPFSDQTEPAIINRLRDAGALYLSLVALQHEALIAHVAFSAVLIDGKNRGFYGLGPVSVHPDHQKCGVGSALIKHGLQTLQQQQAAGCVVLGSPEYYGRFGFESSSRLVLPGPPAEHFQAKSFSGDLPSGQVKFHHAFDS